MSWCKERGWGCMCQAERPPHLGAGGSALRVYFLFNLTTFHTTQGNLWENTLFFLLF